MIILVDCIRNSLIIGNGDGNSTTRLGESLNVDSLLIFNNNPQSNVSDTKSIAITGDSSVTDYTVQAKNYTINSTTIRMGTYDQMNEDDDIGQVKLRVSDIPTKIQDDFYSGGLLETDIKNKSEWTTSAMKLTNRSDLHVKGGIHQYDSHQFVELGYSLSKRTTVLGKLFAHAYVSDGVLYEYEIEGANKFYDNVENQEVVIMGEEVNSGIEGVSNISDTGGAYFYNQYYIQQ